MHTVDSQLAKLFEEVSEFLRILIIMEVISVCSRKGKGNYSYKTQIWEWKVLKFGNVHMEESLNLVFIWPLLQTAHLQHPSVPSLLTPLGVSLC